MHTHEHTPVIKSQTHKQNSYTYNTSTVTHTTVNTRNAKTVTHTNTWNIHVVSHTKKQNEHTNIVLTTLSHVQSLYQDEPMLDILQ